MSLRNSMKGDLELAKGGAWISLANHPNEDGTIPGFLMARQSAQQNPKFAEAVQKLAKREAPVGEQLSVEDAMALDTAVFVEGLLLGWRNFEPDEEGVKVDYSLAEANRIFLDEAWCDLKNFLVSESSKRSNYVAMSRELAAKNS